MSGMSEDRLRELVAKAQAAYDEMTPSQKLRHDYMQRRSWARGMCPDSRDYDEHCAVVDKVMPPESQLTDAEIGLIMAGGSAHGR